MRLGILGGSFDPVHYGHLLLAETCRESCQLDEVWFVPTYVSPHKLESRPAAGLARKDMLDLAIGGHSDFGVCTLELDCGETSYTVDTLAAIQQQRPGAELYFLIGADAMADFPTWREPARICELALLAIACRPPVDTLDFETLRHLMAPERFHRVAQLVVEMPLVDLSSSDIRQRTREHRSIRYRTPPAVVQYIEQHGLYRD